MQKASKFAVWLDGYIKDNGLTQGQVRDRILSALRQTNARDAGATLDTRLIRLWLRSESFPSWRWGDATRNGLSIEASLWGSFGRDWRKNHVQVGAKRRRGLNPKYDVKSIRDLMTDGLTIEQIFTLLERIDEQFPIPPENDLGSEQKWLRVMAENGESGYVLMHEEAGLVGYWWLIPVKEVTYDRLVSGENVNRDLELQDMDIFSMPIDYDVYFVDFFVLEDHFTITTRTLVFTAIAEFLRGLSDHGIFIRRICTHVTTSKARTFCESNGFMFRTNHQEHTIFRSEFFSTGDPDESIPSEVWELDMRNAQIFNRAFFRGFETLESSYREHFKAKT